MSWKRSLVLTYAIVNNLQKAVLKLIREIRKKYEEILIRGKFGMLWIEDAANQKLSENSRSPMCSYVSSTEWKCCRVEGKALPMRVEQIRDRDRSNITWPDCGGISEMSHPIQILEMQKLQSPTYNEMRVTYPFKHFCKSWNAIREVHFRQEIIIKLKRKQNEQEIMKLNPLEHQTKNKFQLKI